MGMTATDYLAELQGLIPQGAAWPRDVNTNVTRLLYGLAEECARVDGRADQLLYEDDPRVTSEMLDDWERAFGLPDPCVTDAQSIAQRRRSLVTRITTIGGQSRQYFIDLAASLGSTITIDEFAPYTVNDDVNTPIYGIEWRYTWRVNGIANPITLFDVTGAVTDPLGSWGTAAVQCLFARLKPAHTNVIFNYT
jgi:uncharacterized protein YmfQ (DUF2313 family)